MRRNETANWQALWERFWAKVDRSGDCWVWIGTRWPTGYGQMRGDGRQLMAHRVAWQIVKGPIPEGLFVCHKCDNPPCVRPDHLFLGTAADNTRDRDVKGRNGYAIKTHCPHGHEYSAENTYRTPKGHRGCRTCMRIKAKRVNAKQREERHARNTISPLKSQQSRDGALLRWKNARSQCCAVPT